MVKSNGVKFLNSVVTLGSSPNEFKVTVNSWRENSFILIWFGFDPRWPNQEENFQEFIFFRWRPNQLIAVQLQKSADVLSTGISKTNWLCSLYFEIFILNELFERQLWFSGIYDFRSVECQYSLCSGVQLVPGHVFSCKYSKRAEISSPPIWWYHELSWLQL